MYFMPSKVVKSFNSPISVLSFMVKSRELSTHISFTLTDLFIGQATLVQNPSPRAGEVARGHEARGHVRSHDLDKELDSTVVNT